MSYILDALKKAESDRERGAVPGLSSAQTNHSTYIHYGSQHRPVWLLLLALCVLLAVALVLWLGRTPAAGVTAPMPASPVASDALAPTPTPTPTSAPAAAPAPVQVPVPVPVQPVPAPPPASALPSVRAVAPVVAKVLPAVVPALAAPQPAAPAEPVVKAMPAAANPVRAASAGIPQLNELPDSLRRQIPALNISGALYSDTPPEWTLIINDQLMSRGSQVAPDLRLEEISASSALFNFKGQRFRVDR